MKEIELIIFDLDGTLVNSQYDLGDAVNFALFKLAKPQLAHEEIPSMLGGGIRKLISLALENTETEKIEEAFGFFKEYYKSNYANKTIFYPEVEATIKKLTNKKKAIYSNKAHRFTQSIISKLGLSDEFEMIQGAIPDKYALKPSPEGLNYILNELNVLPQHALMVGDSTHDIEAAHLAGMKACAVTYGYRSKEILLKKRPEAIIDSMGELLDFF